MNSYYQQQNFLDRIRFFFQRKSILPRLILVNIFIFVIAYFTGLISWLFQIEPINGLSFMADWLAVPSLPAKLIVKPWTVFTYMFFHEGFFHLFFNMWVLYFGGTIFLQYLNERQMLLVYITGGLAGAAFYILAYNIFPVFLSANPVAIAMGASASVLAILVAIATYVPDYTVQLLFIGQLKLRYLAIILVLIDIFSIQGGNPGGHIAHLGGAFWGFIFAILMKNGVDLTQPMNMLGFRRKMKATYKNPKVRSNTNRPLSDEEYNKRRATEQEVIDVILDKIAKSGYDSLNSKEKEILFRNSNRN